MSIDWESDESYRAWFNGAFYYLATVAAVDASRRILCAQIEALDLEGLNADEARDAILALLAALAVDPREDAS